MIHFGPLSPDQSTTVRPGRRPTRRRSNAQVFAWPLLFGLASLLGLVLGLTGDGLRDLACWVLLGLAPLVILAALLRRRSQPSK